EVDGNGTVGELTGDLTLQLAYRPPYDWQGLLRFLKARAMSGVEHVADDSYTRTVALGGRHGWIRVRNREGRRTLSVEIAHTLTPALPALLGRLRHLFDLGARPDVIASVFDADPLMRELVATNPGMRVP